MTPVTKVADVVYYNGTIFTADAANSVCSALAIGQGYILAVGNNEQVLAWATPVTERIDLQGKMMMPGLIDSHMHPFWGGKQLKGCSLHYAALTVEQTLQHIQAHLDKYPAHDDNEWLTVRAWQRQALIPVGADMSREVQ